jgi:uncharacterized protein
MTTTKYWYLDIIHKYIKPDSQAYPFYIIHVTLVTKKAIEIATKLKLNEDSLKFIEEAAMLHDIGICGVEDEDFGTSGGPYITHGTFGADILRKEQYPQHARVAERHTGTGLTREEIIRRDLPLPHQNFIPETIEEQIVCYADLFFSKTSNFLWIERTVDQVRTSVAKFGPDGSKILEEWIKKFE